MTILVIWLGEKGIQLFRIPKGAEVYLKADGVFLNFTDLEREDDTESQQDMVEHLAIMLGTEPYYGHYIPDFETFVRTRESEGKGPKPYLATTEEPTAAHAPWSVYEMTTNTSPLVVDRFIRCGWLP